MKLRLKENPREWFKFTAVAGIFLAIVGLLLRRRGILQIPVWTPLVPGLVALLIGAIFPRALRAPYRAVMTASFHFGKVMGTILLSIFFLLAVTPIALLLRLSGKDLLSLKKRNVESYWSPAKKSSDLDKMF